MSWRDQIQVELIDSMGDDLRVANVARVSFAKWKDQLDGRDVGLIRYLAEHEHSSPFRHTAITVRCSAPISIARQLVKHQVGMSWNEVSRRYVDSGIELFDQPFRFRPDGSIKQGSGALAEDKDVPLVPYLYDKHGNQQDIFEVMDSLDMWYTEAVKTLAPETVRGYMPLNMMTSWIWTGSLPAFFHMYRLRIDGHAQLEAQEFARKAGEAIEPLFPNCWKFLKEYS